jgi:hypothetical protein
MHIGDGLRETRGVQPRPDRVRASEIDDPDRNRDVRQAGQGEVCAQFRIDDDYSPDAPVEVRARQTHGIDRTEVDPGLCEPGAINTVSSWLAGECETFRIQAPSDERKAAVPPIWNPSTPTLSASIRPDKAASLSMAVSVAETSAGRSQISWSTSCGDWL